MFNIGGGELLVILLVALIVLGPNRLPSAARQVGQFMGELRRLSSGFQQELRDALEEPLDTTEPDPGWQHRRRAPSRQAQLRPAAGVDHQARPPVDATATTTAAVPTAEPAVAEPEADPTASSGPVGAAPDAPEAPEPEEAADPTAATGPVVAAPEAPDAQGGERAVG
ncbi:MAG TPA: Sec-independent protein translocase protein TatB [Acidimicrobiales bacterium]